MKGKNLRNTIVGAVIGVAIVAIPAALLLLLIGENNPEPIPNEHFGNIEDVYSPYTAISADDLEGDTDILKIHAVYLHYPDEVYDEYLARYYIPSNSRPEALTLHVRASLPQKGYYNVFGSAERLENGEWVRVGTLSADRSDEYGATGYRLYGTYDYAFPFPVHESGEYRLNYFVSKQHNTSRLYSVSHTLTIPEASGKKFDVVTVDMGYTAGSSNRFYREYSRGGYTVAVLCRSNVDATLYQDLRATRVEKLVDGRWLDINGMLLSSESSYIIELTDSESETPHISPAAYPAEDPFSGDTIENLFCGVAEFEAFDGYDAGVLYRLTLEFIDGPETDAARYALQLTLDLS